MVKHNCDNLLGRYIKKLTQESDYLAENWAHFEKESEKELNEARLETQRLIKEWNKL
jgi:hypothetical protein